MEDVKQNSNMENVCGQGACGHNGTCMNMHRFCYRGCCLLRCILIVIVTAFVFSLGYCAGMHEGREGSWGEMGERSHHSMMYDYDSDGGFGNERNVQVIYRTTNEAMPQQVVLPTTTSNN